MRFAPTGTLALTALLSLALLSCEEKTEQPAAAPRPSVAPTAAAPAAAAPIDDGQMHGHAGAKPGSHEDWCGEHQVPESLCTRCNASLVAAFKATGDWCKEHNLPESQCLLCNPGLKIERPPKETGVEP